MEPVIRARLTDPTPEDTRKVLDEYSKAYLIKYEGFLGFDEYPPKRLDAAMTDLSLHVCRAAIDMEGMPSFRAIIRPSPTGRTGAGCAISATLCRKERAVVFQKRPGPRSSPLASTCS